jgi:hypothetical protein
MLLSCRTWGWLRARWSIWSICALHCPERKAQRLLFLQDDDSAQFEKNLLRLQSWMDAHHSGWCFLSSQRVSPLLPGPLLLATLLTVHPSQLALSFWLWGPLVYSESPQVPDLHLHAFSSQCRIISPYHFWCHAYAEVSPVMTSCPTESPLHGWCVPTEVFIFQSHCTLRLWPWLLTQKLRAALASLLVPGVQSVCESWWLFLRNLLKSVHFLHLQCSAGWLKVGFADQQQQSLLGVCQQRQVLGYSPESGILGMAPSRRVWGQLKCDKCCSVHASVISGPRCHNSLQQVSLLTLLSHYKLLFPSNERTIFFKNSISLCHSSAPQFETFHAFPQI